MKSLRSRLFLLWLLSLAAAGAVGVLLVQLRAQSTGAQVQRAEAVVARACDMIRDRFTFYTAGWDGPAPALDDPALRRDLAVAISIALLRFPGVEGGIWQTEAGSLAYAFPRPGAREGAGFPATEAGRIQELVQQATLQERPALHAFADPARTVLLASCPLGGPVEGMTGWTMTQVGNAPGAAELRLGFAALLLLVLGMAVGLTWLVVSWGRHVGGIEAALARHDIETLPALQPTGERELDRIVGALNEAGTRLAAARRRSVELTARATAAERLAALGRVAAGVAHEIRNPIAVIRLKAENAQAGDDARRRRALDAILEQVDRLDRLSGELLTMTQRRAPAFVNVALAEFLRDCAGEQRGAADAARVELSVEGIAGTASLDPDLTRRALENLLRNAIQHTPPGGRVSLRARRAGAALLLEVEDTGPGVAAGLRAQLFEPFVTGRPDGTGLGLAIARELIEAQGGCVHLARAGGDAPGVGAIFAIELPWPQTRAPEAEAPENACPAS